MIFGVFLEVLASKITGLCGNLSFQLKEEAPSLHGYVCDPSACKQLSNHATIQRIQCLFIKEKRKENHGF